VSNAIYADGRVVAYDKRSPRPAMKWIDYGLSGLDQAALDLIPPASSDLSELFQLLAARGSLCGFEATERFFEIGTPAGLAETEEFIGARAESQP
jgi:NDP-sugar pyrophosphorylase family protein